MVAAPTGVARRTARLAHPLAQRSVTRAEQLDRRGGTPGKAWVCDERKILQAFGERCRMIEHRTVRYSSSVSTTLEAKLPNKWNGANSSFSSFKAAVSLSTSRHMTL
jgi:hypothetical protein